MMRGDMVVLLWLYLLLLRVKFSLSVGEEEEEPGLEELENLVKELNSMEEKAEIVMTVGDLMDMVKKGEESEKIESVALKPWFQKQTQIKNGVNKFDQPVGFTLNTLGEEKKCVEKVVLETETEWNREVQCHHRYRNHCYTTYSTTFTAIQVEECVENYKKNCFIEYGLDAVNHTIRICRKPLEKDCPGVGEKVCSTHFETECWTRQLRQKIEDEVPECEPHVEKVCTNHTVGYLTGQQCKDITRLNCRIKKKVSYKFQPVAECKLTPIELCGPPGCGVRQGREVCHDRRTLVVYDKPEETCTLEPVKTCQFFTKLVPQLSARDKCIDIPLEICVSYDTNPTQVNKPVLKVWCYKMKTGENLGKSKISNSYANNIFFPEN